MHKAYYAGVVLCMLVLAKTVGAQQLRLGKQPLSLQKSAILELESDNQGLLFPRITDTSLINTLAPPDGMVIFHQPSRQLMVRSNGYWIALASTAGLAATWKTTGNAGTDTTINFVGTTDDKPLFLKSNSNTYISMGRRQSLGLTQAYTDYNNNNERVTYLRSALQFEAPGANLYKPKISVDANGNLRFKASAAGTDYVEFGAYGTADAGGFEIITGDEGDEPVLFRSYNATTTTTSEMLRVQSGRMSLGGGAFDASNPERLLIDAGTTTSYNLVSARGSINNYLQLNIQNKSAGTTASSDVVATADNGTETANFIDMGINSSGFNNTTYPVIGGANNAYLYSTGNDFVIGNATTGKPLRFFTGGYAAANERMRIDGSGNVGIGTTSPATLLHVRSGTTGVSGVRLENLTNTSSTTSGSAVLGVDASGNIVRAKAPVYYSGTGTATVDAVTKIWVAEIDNTATGVITVTIPTNIGFTSILAITATAKGGTDVTNAPVATITSNTTTQIVLRIVESKTTGILVGGTTEGLEPHVTTTTKIYLRVEGN
ncbi:hypothetical protein JMG10_01515 [Nostoc ellipsosporum NOK]|nr:hypothetical protein [Nostoc ellipsosporum NOK]